MADIRTPQNTGFTLIEVITVLFVLSIVTVVVVSRWTGTDSELIGQIEVIKSHLRYAQSKALSTSSNWYVRFETSPSPGQYTLFNSASAKQYFPREFLKPEEKGKYPIALKPGISLSAETYILFDHLGRPYTGAPPGAQLNAVQTIVTSSVGNVEVKPETGFIP